MIDPERIGGIVGEALLAGALGALGAMARFSSTDRPLLTRAYLLHALAGGSLGTGAWLRAATSASHPRKRRKRIPPPSKRLGRNVMVPEVMVPS